MAGEVYLWNDGNIALCSIVNDRLNIFLSIETAVGRTVAFGAQTANRGQFGIFLDFYAPALVLSEVEVHRVYLEHGHQIQLFLHILHRDEMAAGCGLTGLLVGMGIEGGAQLGGVITDGEVCTAIGLLAAAVVFMRLGFAAQDREKQTKKIHQQPGNTVQRSRRAG